MKNKLKFLRLLLIGLFIISTMVDAQGPVKTTDNKAGTVPVIPFGLDSYRMWDKWPQQRLEIGRAHV